MMSDPDGVVTFFNRRWYEFTGQDPFERDVQDDWQRYMHPDDGARVREAWYDAVRQGRRLVKMRYRLRGGAKSEYRWFAAQAAALEDEAGNILQWVGTAVDVDDETNADHALHRLLEMQTAVAERYQRAALPAQFPAVPGLRFDAQYRASEHALLVGGDWYDAFALPDGRVAVSIGDIVGHGLDAAVTMAKIRQSGRAVALWSARAGRCEPAGVLEAMEQALISERSELIATAIFGIIDRRAGTFEYASAGHPPPLLKAAGGEVRELPFGGTPLGCPLEPRPTHRVPLAGASALLLYTDGVVEGTKDLDDGIATLQRAVRRLEPGTEDAAAVLLGAARRSADDDAAILLVQLTT